MGCALSKRDSKLVKLCRERKELIKAARDGQHSFASAHMAYFQSLQDVENELRNFVEESLVICFNLPSDTGLDQQTTEEVPQSETSSGYHEDDDDITSLTDSVHRGSNLSELQLKNESGQIPMANSYNGKSSLEGVPTRGLQQPQGSPPKMPSFLIEPQNVNSDGTMKFPPGSFSYPQFETGRFFPSDNLVFPPFSNEFAVNDLAYNLPDTSNPEIYGSRMSSDHQINFPYTGFRPTHNETGTPSRSYMNTRPNSFSFNMDASGPSFSAHTEYPSLDQRFFRNGSGGLDNYLSGLQPNGSWLHQTQIHYGQTSIPSDRGVSAWDYLNPFSMDEDAYTNAYSRHTYDSGFGSDDMDLRKLREMEGIPDLEDALDDEMEEASDEEGLESSEDSDQCNCGEVDLTKGKQVYLDQQESENTDDTFTKIGDETMLNKTAADFKSRSSFATAESLNLEEIKSGASEDQAAFMQMENKIIEGQEASVEKEMQSSRTNEADEFIQQSGTVADIASNMVAHRSKDPQEALNEINNASDTIAMHVKDVSTILKANSLRYVPGRSYFSFKSSGATSKPMLALKHWVSRRSYYRTLKGVKNSYENLENNAGMSSGNLSLTLEKLYIWENKLYKNVKDEEKLRFNFEEEWRKLRKLEDRGAEVFDVVSGQLSVERLLPRVSVAVSKVERIARTEHNIMVEELLPQLCDLIHSLREMWKILLESHKKQVEAIMEVGANLELTFMNSDSSLSAAQNLETKILHLGATFSEWMKAQKAFVEHLKTWLTKCLLQEPGETSSSDNPSYSPSSAGARTAFIMCNDWLSSIERVSESNVLVAINKFALFLHNLCENLVEERQQRVRMEYLSSYHEKKLKKICTESGLDWGDYSVIALAETDAVETGISYLDAEYASLRSVRIKLNAVKSKHDEVTRQLNDAAATILQNGFISMVEALNILHSKLYTAYGQIRTPDIIRDTC